MWERLQAGGGSNNGPDTTGATVAGDDDDTTVRDDRDQAVFDANHIVNIELSEFMLGWLHNRSVCRAPSNLSDRIIIDLASCAFLDGFLCLVSTCVALYFLSHHVLFTTDFCP